MQLTSRDHHMLQWINGHGFVTVEQAARWKDVSYPTGQRRLQKLAEAGYLQRRKVERNGPSANWLTKKGWALSGDDLAPPKRINRLTYFHDRALVDIALSVEARTGGVFWPQRRLKADKTGRQDGQTRRGLARGPYAQWAPLYRGQEADCGRTGDVGQKAQPAG